MSLSLIHIFVQFAGPEPDEEYPFTVCGQTVLLCNAALAAALSAQPKQTQEVIFRYYFLQMCIRDSNKALILNCYGLIKWALSGWRLA